MHPRPERDPRLVHPDEFLGRNSEDLYYEIYWNRINQEELEEKWADEEAMPPTESEIREKFGDDYL